MRKLKYPALIFIMFLFIISFHLDAQGKISGVVFGDYYYMFSNHNPGIEGMNGFWFRRLYLTYDHNLSSAFKIRIRFEAYSKGDFSTKEEIIPHVKDIYIQWSKNGQSIILGLSPTPTFGKIEKFWGYRAVEKTPLDLYKMAHSRDTGIAFKGKIAKGKIYYHLMFANGEGNKSEFNKQKKVMGAIGFYPTGNLYLEFYSDYESGPINRTDVYTLQGFIGFAMKKFTFGAMYANQIHQLGEEDLKLRVLSITTVFDVSQKITLFGRYDRMMDPLPAGPAISYLPMDSSSPFSLVIGGMDYKISSSFSLIPNIEFVIYDKLNSNDIVGKLTFLYKW